VQSLVLSTCSLRVFFRRVKSPKAVAARRTGIQRSKLLATYKDLEEIRSGEPEIAKWICIEESDDY